MSEWKPGNPHNQVMIIGNTDVTIFYSITSLSVKCCHYSDVMVSAMASQVTSLRIVYSTFDSSADQTKYQSSASLASVRGTRRWPMISPHKGPMKQKCFNLMKPTCVMWISHQAARLWILCGFVVSKSVTHNLLSNRLVIKPLILI